MRGAPLKLIRGGIWLVLGLCGAFIMYDPDTLTPGYIAAWGTLIGGGIQLARGVLQLMHDS